MHKDIGVILKELGENRVVVCAFVAWLSAEVLKFIIDAIRRKDWNIRHLFSSGGMPSSHTAAVFSVTMAVGFHEGFNTALFAVCGVFALIVMYDAAGVRQETGKQGSVLNMLLDWMADLTANPNLDDIDMKERVGHKPIEVMAGAIWGLIWSLLFFYVF